MSDLDLTFEVEITDENGAIQGCVEVNAETPTALVGYLVREAAEGIYIQRHIA